MTIIPHLSAVDLDGLNVTTAQVIDIIERMICGADSGTVFAAPKSVIQTPDGRYIMSTLAMANAPAVVATKSLVLNARNSDIGLPQINAVVTLIHGETGVPLMTIDGNWVTAVRTAGLSAVAAKYLANPASRTAGFVGTGVQARSHLTAFAEMFPLEHIKLSGRGRANIETLIALADELGLSHEVVETPREAVSGVDIVTTSVTHTGVEAPFLDANWLDEGAFAAVADLGVPWHQNSFASVERVYIDDLDQEAQMASKLVDPEQVNGDLAALIKSPPSGYPTSAFVFRGHALGDLALAALVFELSA